MNQSVNLMLRTSDGVNTATNNSCNWDVDMECVLGNMFYEYDYFNLSLIEVVCGILPVGSGLTSHGNFQTIVMTGLNWENCNYNVSTNKSESKSCVGVINLTGINTISSKIISLPNTGCNTFKKGAGNTNITIALFDVASNNPGSTLSGSNTFCKFTYLFQITPCESYDDTCATFYLIGNTATNFNSGATKLYKNVNIKNMLGNMYGKYDKFLLTLVIAQSTSISATISANSFGASIQLVGLPFITSYGTTSKTIMNSGILGDISFWGGLSAYNGTELNTATIINPPTTTDIVINYISTETGNPITITAGTLPSVTILIKITPII